MADGAVVRDSLGIAIGGIKIPQVAVPTSSHGAPNGDRATNLICFLQGYEIPFDEATVSRLYPTHEAYVAAIDAATTDLQLRGFILPEDAEAERLRAEQSSIGGRPPRRTAAGRRQWSAARRSHPRETARCVAVRPPGRR